MWCTYSRCFILPPLGQYLTVGSNAGQMNTAFSLLPFHNLVENEHDPEAEQKFLCLTFPAPCLTDLRPALEKDWPSVGFPLGTWLSGRQHQKGKSLLTALHSVCRGQGAGHRTHFLEGIVMLLRSWQFWFKSHLSYSLVMWTFTLPFPSYPPLSLFFIRGGGLTLQTALGEIDLCNLLALDLEQLIYKNLSETQFIHLEKVTERIKLIEIMCLMHNTQDQAQIWCPLEW